MQLQHLFTGSDMRSDPTRPYRAASSAIEPRAPGIALPEAGAEVRIRPKQPAPAYDLEAEERGALERNPRQWRKHAAIRGSAARTVRTRGRDIYTTDVPMTRLGNQAASGEGMLEGDAWSVIDFMYGDITYFAAQPFPVDIQVFGQRYVWWPDALMRRRGRPYLVEVKPVEKVHIDPQLDPEGAAFASARFDAMRRAAAERGADFLLLTESEIRVQPRLQNSQIMFRALNAHIPEGVVLQAADALADLPRETGMPALAELLPAYRPSLLLIACVLDRRALIQLDRATPFSPTSRFINSLGTSA